MHRTEQQLRTDEELAISSQEGTPKESGGIHSKRKRTDSGCKGSPSNKRLSNSSRLCRSDNHDCSQGSQGSTVRLDPTLFGIHEVACPEECSLYNTVKLRFKLTTDTCFPIQNANLQPIRELISPSQSKNGLWFAVNPPASCKIKQEFAISIQLLERDETNAVRLVQLCAKCSKKKSHVIELAEQKVPCDGNGFVASIVINEQCAHRAQNQYGTPKIRFYFGIQLHGNTERGGEKVIVQTGKSNDIKVVAPGKCQGTSKKSAHSQKAIMTVLDLHQRMISDLEMQNTKLQNQVDGLHALIKNLTHDMHQMKQVKVEVENPVAVADMTTWSVPQKMEYPMKNEHASFLQQAVAFAGTFVPQVYHQSQSQQCVEDVDFTANFLVLSQEGAVNGALRTSSATNPGISADGVPFFEMEDSIDADTINSLSQELLKNDPEAMRLTQHPSCI
eukprot:TRINITY_DN3943_c0_g1_i1.p1 TRINITY_DN3943_c0_g1~~TRINITY_DN3943_c0_g1_i1.p1  ORF type:complete len:446 (+),score=118.39 TRINITY_DN3943_c0_g1_i1:235-1572(+)